MGMLFTDLQEANKDFAFEFFVTDKQQKDWSGTTTPQYQGKNLVYLSQDVYHDFNRISVTETDDNTTPGSVQWYGSRGIETELGPGVKQILRFAKIQFNPTIAPFSIFNQSQGQLLWLSTNQSSKVQVQNMYPASIPAENIIAENYSIQVEDPTVGEFDVLPTYRPVNIIVTKLNGNFVIFFQTDTPSAWGGGYYGTALVASQYIYRTF